MKIHGSIYLIIGVFIAGFSYYVTSINEKLDLQKFMLFVWVGVVFTIIGLFKIISNGLSKPKKPKIAKENFHHHQIQNNMQQQSKVAAPSNPMVKFCSNCGSAVRHFDNFCYKCGNRAFHRK
jgi:UDP-N-acetylmuramyl pentapeptide phosphotransferase/UDP-N-acetylglucosamine-1-phosphate transferase